MKQLLRRHGRNHRFVLEAGRLVPKGADPIIPQEGIPLGIAPRMVYGQIQNDGTILDAGSGDWTVEWSGSGAGAPGYPAQNIYSFTVDPAFSDDIVNVLVTPNLMGDGNDPYLAVTDPVDADTVTFVVETFNFIGDPADTNFSFAAFEDPA